MDSSKIKAIFLGIIAAFAAIYLGIASATAQVEAIAWVSGVLFIVFIFALGRHIWVLIPIFSVLGGNLTFVPGYPSPWYAITPVVAIMLLLRFLMRARNFTYQFTRLDFLILLQIMVLGQAYLRNPTGLALFGSTDMIGGRPYVDYAVAIFSYFLLATVKTDWKIIKRVILIMAIVSLLDNLLKGATGFSGGLSRAVGKIYTNVDYEANAAGSAYAFDIATTRFTSLTGLGIVISQILFSFNRPLNCLLPIYPLRFILMMFSLAVTFLSGFRSEIIRIVCLFICSTLVRRRVIDVVVGAALAVLMLSLTIAFVGTRNLPHAAQRALSFLPIEVDADIRSAAEASSNWRFEMWRIVLTSDRYIKNKVLGDGFGFTAAEHEAQQQSSLGLKKYQGDSIDAFIAKGSYHGWHVEAIRFTGVLGLIIGTIILLSFAATSLSVIRFHEKKELYPYALFLCIPFIISPFFTIFIFGSYKGNFTHYIAMCGMLRLVYGLQLAELRQPVALTSSFEEPKKMIQKLGNKSSI
jgi:hypothetical protein